jgi:hypothetical protein
MGEPVETVFTNNCQVPISFSSDPPWIISNKEGKTVFPIFVEWVEVEVPPGDRKTWTDNGVPSDQPGNLD